MSFRIDVWDVKKNQEPVNVDCGYRRDFDELFTVDRTIGKGGFGLVRVVIEKATGKEFACKSIKKKLDIPNLSAEKVAQHLDNVDREAKILKRLRGTLSVVAFKGAWEDDVDVHLVMEYCRGGELHHRIGQKMYTEGTVAAYMRSVLHTLAQCHSHRILHRDIKPGNFMLLSDEEGAPLKAIDFGLAVFFEPDALPRTDLGLEGTPWFMAPEVLNSETWPASDVWAAGIMCYQLLSGYLPFDDNRNPNAPALSVIWKGILTEEPSFRRSAWTEVSQEAKDFVKTLLNKDHEQRPSSKEALKHPWIQPAFHAGKTRPLSATVVQRIQRFAQTNILRRTILELMAGELLKLAPPQLSSDASLHAASMAAAALHASAAATPVSPLSNDHAAVTPTAEGLLADEGSAHNGAMFFPMSPEGGIGGDGGGSMLAGGGEEGSNGGMGMSSSRSGPIPMRSKSGGAELSWHGGRSFPRSPSVQQLATLAKAANRRGVATVHGPSDYWRIMRQAAELGSMSSGHGQMNYLRAVPRSEDERQEQRKAARLSMDTSSHGGGRYAELLAKLEAEGSYRPRKISGNMRGSASMGALMHHMSLSAPASGDGLAAAAESMDDMQMEAEAGPAAARTPLPPVPLFPPVVEDSAAEASPMDTEEVMERGGRGRKLAYMALKSEESSKVSSPEKTSGRPPPSPSPFDQPTQQQQPAADKPSLGSGPRVVKRVTFPATEIQPSGFAVPPPPTAHPHLPAEPSRPMPVRAGSHSGPVTNPQELESLMRRLKFKHNQVLGKDALAEGLRQLGYDLAPTEMAILLDQLDLDADQSVAPAEFVASQMDWGAMQRNNRELWLECARRAFADLDSTGNGRLTAEMLVGSLRNKLPEEEVDFALEDAMLEAGGVNPEDIDFEGFLKMLHVGSLDSLDSLDQYDDRMRRVTSADLLDSSSHGGPSSRLQTVLEEGVSGQQK